MSGWHVWNEDKRQYDWELDEPETNNMIECENCAEVFDPIATRWRCPACGYKMSCCEGEPLGGVDGQVSS